MKVGYCRVSTKDQDLSLQTEKLEEFGCENLFAEKKSGASRQGRPQLDSALDFVREGDILVITKLTSSLVARYAAFY